MGSIEAMHAYYAGQRIVAIPGALVAEAYPLIAWAAFHSGHVILRAHSLSRYL